MKEILTLLLALALSPPLLAQDVLQQSRDSATRRMIDLRSAYKPWIEANGWVFVTATLSAEDVPISDIYMKGIKVEKGSIRSAYLLNTFYAAVSAVEFPEYQSSKMLVWFDCKEGSFEQRILERYASVDGSGNPNSREAEKQSFPMIEMPGADPQSFDVPLLAAVCSAKR